MTEAFIRKTATAVAAMYGRDPMSICDARRIYVREKDLGSLLGMFTTVCGNRFILLNRDLSPQMRKTVCAHELGHYFLHRDFVDCGTFIRDFIMLESMGKIEREANLFSGFLLLGEDLVSLIRSGCEAEEIAEQTGTTEFLIRFMASALFPK